MSLHKLSAANGYTYLTRQVAAADATHRGRTSLDDFYAAKGESPGLWTGSGLSGLGGIEAGDQVSARQMQALFGQGRHPNADSIAETMIAAGSSPAQTLRASKLGQVFPTFDNAPPLRAEVSRRFTKHNTSLHRAWNAPISADERARIRTEVATQMFANWQGRPPKDSRELSRFITEYSRRPKTAVAGFDLTFSPVKSVSTLWAIAPPEIAAAIQQAQGCAVASTLGWLERDASFTRTGPGSVLAVEVTGLIAAAFTHRDARSGDPDLHTHVAVSSKVQSLNGAWLALSSRVLFNAVKAASSRYDTRIEAELVARLGVRFETRWSAVPSRSPVREVVGVDPRLNASWSSRRVDIVLRRHALSTRFQLEHGRAASSTELNRLAQVATLQTRAAKHGPRSYADQRATWWAQATQVLGGEHGVEAMIRGATKGIVAEAIGAAQPVTGHWVTEQWLNAAAAAVVAKVSRANPSWQVWNIRSEAERAARYAGVARGELDGAVDAVVTRALSQTHSFPLAAGAARGDPGGPCRRDGSSAYTVPGATRFSARTVIGAQASAHSSHRPAEVSLPEWPTADVTAQPAQARLPAVLATSTARRQPAPGPGRSHQQRARGRPA